jgi:hypothetical protein
MWVAVSLGGAWGLAGYALLWGLTPIVLHRAFVVSPLGTLLLLPVRGVLLAIRLVEERIAGRPFQLADNHGWIALAAAAAGAVMACAVFVAVRGAVRLLRREGRG